MKPPSEKSASRRPSRPSYEPLQPHEIELADFFVRMAGILGVPRETVRSRLRVAREQLRKVLGEAG